METPMLCISTDVLPATFSPTMTSSFFEEFFWIIKKDFYSFLFSFADSRSSLCFDPFLIIFDVIIENNFCTINLFDCQIVFCFTDLSLIIYFKRPVFYDLLINFFFAFLILFSYNFKAFFSFM